MKTFGKYSTISALLVLLTFSMASQAAVVDQGPRTGSWADFGTFTLDPGNYTIDLAVVGLGGPTVFGIVNVSEAFQVAVATFGKTSSPFTTVGGSFQWLAGGNAGAFTAFTAEVNAVPAPVPLPSSVIMIGSALAAMVSIGRRGASRRVRA